MRLRFVFLLLFILTLFNLTASPTQAQGGDWKLEILEANTRHLLLELTLPSFEIEIVVHNGIQYQRLRVPGWGYWGQPGYPRLPRHSVPVGLPWPGDPKITVVEIDSEVVPVDLIYPTPALTSGGTDEEPQVVETFAIDADAYHADTVYPGLPTEATDYGLLRDQSLFQLRFYPFQYNPVRQELTVHRRLRVLVTFPSAPLSPADVTAEPMPPSFEKILQQTLVNYNSLPRPPAMPSSQSGPPPASELAPFDAQGSYVIVTHPDFYNAVQGLATYRVGQGESVVVVKTDDLYDQYNGGVKSAQAIRDFLVDAYTNWSTKPVYVLLVGDASDDPATLPDLLPAYYVATLPFGEAPNDGWYAKVNGDDNYPDLIVGRIPARSEADVTTVANKVQAYEQFSPLAAWFYRGLLVADDNDPVFQGDMELVANLLPANIIPTKIYAYDPSTSVQNEIGAGTLLVAYSGHGSGSTKWGRWPNSVRIYEQAQMPGLWNGDKLPFMTVANCRNGLFSESSRERAMAEEFLLLNNKGGIAVWAPSSYAFPTIDTLMYEALYETMFTDDDLILGSATTTARAKVHLDDPDLPLAHIETFTFFGDPAVRLNLPDLPISGLAADNDSPTPLASTTTLSATIVGGTHVVYTWNFGDGSSPESGLPIQHTYPATGTYTAYVTATNNVSSQSISTTVVIESSASANDPAPVFLPVIVKNQ
jgi:hypothetical protein